MPLIPRLGHGSGRRACALMAGVPINAANSGRSAAVPRAARGRLPAGMGGVRNGRRTARGSGPREQKGHTIVTTMDSAEPTRRDFLYIATGAVGAIGAATVLVPLIGQMNPDASTIAAGAPIEVGRSPLARGQILTAFWRSKAMYIRHR